MVFIFKNTTKPKSTKKYKENVMFSLKKQAQKWANDEYKIRLEEDQGRTPVDSNYQLSIQTIEMLLAETTKSCFLTVHYNDLTGSQQSFVVEVDGDILWVTPEEATVVANQIVADDPELTVEITNIDDEV